MLLTGNFIITASQTWNDTDLLPAVALSFASCSVALCFASLRFSVFFLLISSILSSSSAFFALSFSVCLSSFALTFDLILPCWVFGYKRQQIDRKIPSACNDTSNLPHGDGFMEPRRKKIKKINPQKYLPFWSSSPERVVLPFLLPGR
ncbi:hypothetical protein EDD21DRAFT_100267 [Dissophora ornata]|nr:hypothetical protein EDD21DRAFT_100267 [Dissophora ornata]